MTKNEYKFNPQSLIYEKVKDPGRIRRYRVVRKLLIAFMLAAVINILYASMFYTPKLEHLNRQNRELMLKYQILNDRLSADMKKLREIKHRDNFVYRALFAADSLSIDGIYNSYPQSKYASMAESRFTSVMLDTWYETDAFARQLYQESVSFDQLQSLSKDKEKMSTAIPAIWPINKKNLKGHIGAFGQRIHPIYHRYIFHKGIDLGGHVGDPVYATGNAVVEQIETRYTPRRGYGKQIVLDHGFGYQTRYAHLSDIFVQPGQVVRRGELIGKVGTTGGSTGPHLHYEVLYTGKNVDPINYFRRDMDETEFERIIESAKETTFETDDMEYAPTN